MTEIDKTFLEDRARALLNAATEAIHGQRGAWGAADMRKRSAPVEAVCRLIEAGEKENAELRAERNTARAELEAVKKRFSDVAKAACDALISAGAHPCTRTELVRFILPAADPLVEAWAECFPGDPQGARDRHVAMIRAALSRRDIILSEAGK